MGCSFMVAVVLTIKDSLLSLGYQSLVASLLVCVSLGALTYGISVYISWSVVRRPSGAESFVLGFLKERLRAH